jgi:hypothetical protein
MKTAKIIALGVLLALIIVAISILVYFAITDDAQVPPIGIPNQSSDVVDINGMPIAPTAPFMSKFKNLFAPEKPSVNMPQIPTSETNPYQKPPPPVFGDPSLPGYKPPTFGSLADYLTGSGAFGPPPPDPIDGYFTPWEQWNVTFGNRLTCSGEKYEKKRIRKYVPPQYDGEDVEGPTEQLETGHSDCPQVTSIRISGQKHYGIAELAMFNYAKKDVVLGGLATGSGFTDGNTYENLIDGDSDTEWKCNQEGDVWAVITLPRPVAYDDLSHITMTLGIIDQGSSSPSVNGYLVELLDNDDTLSYHTIIGKNNKYVHHIQVNRMSSRYRTPANFTYW